MKWWLQVKLFYRTYKFQAEIVDSTNVHERIKISGRNDSIILQNNRPFFVSKGLRHRRWVWKQVEGRTISKGSFYGTIIQELEKHLRQL